ncbi:hypothetical protein [Erythrobacter ani]|uniref:DUF883 domain-containing protein n=1 Tax=Erythrobacter ani TaxID=2827235 RepID=A0ABS6SR81_9SPHN|nr:hypothetical protein [Erythrobacter ani]MBV7267144.1 hypothetical protein [Erythrobacter ani]
MTETDDKNTPVTIDKRDQLRAKIEASERRNEQRTLADQAKEAAGAATNYAREHPLTVLGGAIAVGLVIGAMTSPGRRAARGVATGTVNAVNSAASSTKSAVGNVSTKQVSRFGTLIADAITAYGIKLIDDAMETAQAGQDKLEDIGDSAGSKARKLRRDAEYFAGSAADKSREVTRRTRRRAGRAVRDLKDKVTH